MSALFHGHLSSNRIDAALQQLISLGAIDEINQLTEDAPLPSGLRYPNRIASPRQGAKDYLIATQRLGR
jgi:HrpA-like RNA helicase